MFFLRIKSSYLITAFLCAFVHIHAYSSSPTDGIDNATLCQDFLENLTNPSYQGPNVSLEVNNFLLYSGHSPNDLGMYKNCSELPTQRYIVIESEVGVMGLCGPSFCSVAQLQNYTDSLVKIFSVLTKKDLSQLDIQLVDPDQTGVEQGFWLYFTIFIYTIIVGLVVAGTISANFIKRPKPSSLSPASFPDPSSRDILLLNKDSCNDEVVSRGLITSNLQTQPTPATKTLTHRKTLFIRVIECFDIASNLQALFKHEEVPGQDQNLNVFNGIRALSFGWVVYGHTVSISAQGKNFLFSQLYMKSAWALIAVGAFYAVDTFFYLSGFFTGFLLVSKLKRMRFGLKSYAMILFHRWIRLWPAYFIAILFYWKISVNFGSGPLWNEYVMVAQACGDSAWKNLLFLDNVLNKKFIAEYCFSWGWYLACDFQMFLLAPFICWIYIKDRARSQTIIWVLMTFSVITGYLESLDTGYTYYLDNSPLTDPYLIKYYVNATVRMSPYLLGLLLGFLFKEYKEGRKNFFTLLRDSNLKSFICSIAGFGLLLFLTFFPRVLQTGATWSTGFATTWNILARPFWTFGIFLLTAPCLVGKLRALSSFLRNFYLTLIARVSYTAYLVHLVFIETIFRTTTQVFGLSQAYQTCLTFSIMIFSCAGAVVLHLFVEKPITNIETRLLNGKKEKKSQEKEPIIKSTGA